MAHRRRILNVVINQAAGSADLVAAPGAGMKIYVVGFVLTAGAASTVKFQSGAGATDLTGPMDFAANGGLVVIGEGDEARVLETNLDNEKLTIVVGGTGPVHGFLRYYLSVA